MAIAPAGTHARQMTCEADVELIRQTMHARGGGKKVAPHGPQRIAQLVTPESVVFCDAALADSPADYFFGRVVAFTETRVVVADLGDGGEGEVRERVSAHVFARRSLQAMALLGWDSLWTPSDDNWDPAAVDALIPALAADLVEH
jgi:hypothetical protein